MCDLTWCKTEKPGTIEIFETIGDGSFSLLICDDCADRLGIREYIDPANPHAIIELKKRLLQNAALSIALMSILHYGHPADIVNDQIPSNLPEYADQ